MHLKNCNNYSLRKPIKKTSQNGGNMKKTTRSKKYQIGHFALQIPPPVNERQVGRLADPPYVATVPLATKKRRRFPLFPWVFLYINVFVLGGNSQEPRTGSDSKIQESLGSLNFGDISTMLIL